MGWFERLGPWLSVLLILAVCGAALLFANAYDAVAR